MYKKFVCFSWGLNTRTSFILYQRGVSTVELIKFELLLPFIMFPSKQTPFERFLLVPTLLETLYFYKVLHYK